MILITAAIGAVMVAAIVALFEALTARERRRLKSAPHLRI